MQTINITCPKCKLNMEYWTKNSQIECVQCKTIIKVEPCEDIVDEAEEVEEDET